MPAKIKLLVKLHPGYGLGDHVQMTAVMRHVLAARPDWQIDFQGDAGKSDCMLGLAEHVFTHDAPANESDYDRVAPIALYDVFSAWTDRPNTRVSNCLHEKFGMKWKPELGRYVVNFLSTAFRMPNTVMFHYRGISAGERKNLLDFQVNGIVKTITALGMRVGTLPNKPSAIENATYINSCDAFIGIDSGPSKCASATNTPSLVCWTQHHPALFHDPAPNTTHLVPINHRQNPLLQGNHLVADWFEANYLWRTYDGESDLVNEVAKWLKEVVK